mgnify:CR=1 FL=1
MGTKKGGARKGQPKGARLGYDDLPKKKTKKKKIKINVPDRNELTVREWSDMLDAFTRSGVDNPVATLMKFFTMKLR